MFEKLDHRKTRTERDVRVRHRRGRRVRRSHPRTRVICSGMLLSAALLPGLAAQARPVTREMLKERRPSLRYAPSRPVPHQAHRTPPLPCALADQPAAFPKMFLRPTSRKAL